MVLGALSLFCSTSGPSKRSEYCVPAGWIQLTSASYVAVLGALTTILASLLGFFSQQLVQFQNCLEKNMTASANILWTNAYAQGGGSIQSNVNAAFPPMIAAINVGLLQRTGDLTNVLSSGCSTGNCSFSEVGNASYSTVAISHSCEDSTDSIHVLNQTRINNSTVETYLGLDYGDNNTFTWSNESSSGIGLLSWMDLSSTSWPIYILSRSSPFTYDWKVFNCSLSPTVNTYEARIQDAKLEEIQIESIPLQEVYTQFPQPPVEDYNLSSIVISWRYRTATNYTIRNGIRESCEGSATNASGLVMFPKSSDEPNFVNSTGHTNPSAGWKWWFYPSDCIWSLHKVSRVTIEETLAEIFDHQNVTLGRRGGAASGSAHLQVLWNAGNMTLHSIDQKMEDLATQMTTVIRTNGGDGNLKNASDNAEGIIWTNTTCVYVRWRWISFPAATLGLTGLFLIWILFENRGIEKDRLWKSSFLAALFCEVEMHQRPVGKKEMGSMAKSTSVSLEGSSGRLRMVAG